MAWMRIGNECAGDVVQVHKHFLQDSLLLLGVMWVPLVIHQPPLCRSTGLCYFVVSRFRLTLQNVPYDPQTLQFIKSAWLFFDLQKTDNQNPPSKILFLVLLFSYFFLIDVIYVVLYFSTAVVFGRWKNIVARFGIIMACKKPLCLYDLSK